MRSRLDSVFFSEADTAVDALSISGMPSTGDVGEVEVAHEGCGCIWRFPLAEITVEEKTHELKDVFLTEAIQIGVESREGSARREGGLRVR